MKPDAKKKVEFFFICALVVLVISFFAFSIYLSKKEENGEFGFNSFKSGFISVEDCIADYNFFWDFIYNEYPFTEVCERKGADLKKIKEDGLKKLLSKPNTPNDYYKFYFDLCKTITLDRSSGHLFPVSYNSFYDDFSAGVTKRMTFFYNADKVKSFYASKPGYDESYSKRKIEAKIKIIEEGKIAYVKIDTFFVPYGEPDISQKFYRDMKKFFIDTQDYKHIIIDISENRGGYTIFYEKGIIGCNIDSEINFNYYCLCHKNLYTKWFFEHESPYVKRVDISNVPNIENARTKKHDTALFMRYYIRKNEISNYKRNQDRRFWLLVSSKSFSASDAFARLCKETGFATVVGTNTGGLFNGTSPMNIMLPNSGMLISSDILYGLTPEGFCIEDVGTAPDIYNLPGKDALETCLEEIKKLENKK